MRTVVAVAVVCGLLCHHVASQASFCTFANTNGCFIDGPSRALPFLVMAMSEDNLVTIERCATACSHNGYTLAGVEAGSQCFCGNAINPGASPAPFTDCSASKCAGNTTQDCGGSNRILIGTIGSCTSQPPNYHACLDDASQKLPFCDHTLDIETRVKDLMSRMTLDEKINMISPQGALGDTCETHTAGVPSVGVGPYGWLVETNTGIATACIAEGVCSTTFSGPMGMGASFNRSSWRLKGSVFGTEMRAFTNSRWHRGEKNGNGMMIGLTGYGPNINIARDPRFGRSSELPGEDPVLSGTYAAEMVMGMQEQDQAGHPKMIALLKHFTAYSRETGRGSDTYAISQHDLWETYLAQYEIAFTKGNASGVMCSYNGINGHPSCANGYILNDVIRGKWSRDALVSTDCGAVQNLFGPPVYAPSAYAAAAYAINNGTDIEMGSTVWGYALSPAISQNLVSPATLDASVRRSLLVLFRAGRFDPVETIEWFKYNISDIGSPYHKQIQYEAALQSLVLLKNANNTLPIKRGVQVAVLGPQAIARDGLLSDYFGDQVCYDLTFNCIPTIAEQIAAVNGADNVKVAKGVDMNSNDASGIQEALALIPQADIVVLAIGIDRSIEHEGQDRTDTALPGLQQSFAEQVLKAGKPVVIVLTNGGQLAIDTLIDGSQAIVEAFNPSVAGARAIAETLFGLHNRWGKLPVTMYPHDYINQQPMTNYDMSIAPGRTYRYYTGTPLFSFGTGLSYTTFSLSCSPVLSSSPSSSYIVSIPRPNRIIVTPTDAFASDPSPLFQITCNITNTGSVDGDEVVMLFHSAGSDIRSKVNHPVPLKALKDFERLSVATGETLQSAVLFQITQQSLQLVNENGDLVLYPGLHTIALSRGQEDDVAIEVLVEPTRGRISEALSPV